MSDYKNVFTLDTNFSKYGLILVNPIFKKTERLYRNDNIYIRYCFKSIIKITRE